MGVRADVVQGRQADLHALPCRKEPPAHLSDGGARMNELRSGVAYERDWHLPIIAATDDSRAGSGDPVDGYLQTG